MILRPPTPEDAQALARMGGDFVYQTGMGRALGYDPDSLIRTIATLTGSDIGTVLVVEEDDEIVGAAAAIMAPAFFNHSAIIANELFWWVDPKARGSRASQMLLDGLEAWASASGADLMVMVSVDGMKHRSVGKLYERAGYVPVEHSYARGI